MSLTAEPEPKTILECIAELAESAGVAPLDGKVWEYQVDEQWWFAINGNKNPRGCSRLAKHEGTASEIPPFCIYVEFNGWPAGLFHPIHGGQFAAGSAANEGAFIRALEQCLARTP